jgi:ubiquinone/menaquinone biosynthesis C-methylase UbiE
MGKIHMNNSRSFDRAASFYDQTRPLAEPIAQPGIQAILDITGPGKRILDVGTGTGRISIPLLERGLDLIGCDLSAKMLRRLQEKLPEARIAQADAAYLPFPSDHFEFVMTVHILHLIPSWRDVLREVSRVLKPGGAYLNVKTWGSSGVSIRERLRIFWRDWLQTQGFNASNPGLQDQTEFMQELRSMGAHVREVEVLRYPLTYTLREELERFAGRIYSDSWDIPNPVFEVSVKELRSWAEAQYGDLDQERADEVRFAIDIAQFS